MALVLEMTWNITSNIPAVFFFQPGLARATSAVVVSSLHWLSEFPGYLSPSILGYVKASVWTQATGGGPVLEAIAGERKGE